MLFFTIGLIILILDQLTKYIVVINMYPNQTIPVIENVFHITYVRNPGAAFGILQNQILFFILITFAVVLVLIGVYWKVAHRKNLVLTVALALQLGGAIGNLIDRIRYSSVVDFFDFRIWPVFNIADMAIVVGVILFAWQLLIWHEKG
ncbi:MAG: signal peptidase II [Bacillota bacterium]